MNKYGVKTPAELKPECKIDLARILHYDYLAGNKQISRLLKIGLDTVSSLFAE